MTDKVQSNKFLRALWANFRTNFGKCSWYYCPSKDGKTKIIYLGSMDIGVAVTDVSISYERKGIIKEIYFKNIEERSQVGQEIENIVIKAMLGLELISKYTFYITLSSFSSFCEYQASNFAIKSVSKFQSLLKLVVSGYDEKDARYQMLMNLEGIMAVLSVETNCPFWISKSKKSISMNFNKSNDLYTEDLDWMDGYPQKDGFMTISPKCIDVLNEIAGTYIEISTQLENFTRSCHQFHLARKQDAQVWDGDILNEIRRHSNLDVILDEDAGQTEIATVLYMSSLESATLIYQENITYCGSCGQPQYSISNRVKNLVKRFTNLEFATWIQSDYYSKRSKFLHAGKILTGKYIGVSIPTLDENGEGIAIYEASLPNIREYTSFILRKVLYDIF